MPAFAKARIVGRNHHIIRIGANGYSRDTHPKTVSSGSMAWGDIGPSGGSRLQHDRPGVSWNDEAVISCFGFNGTNGSAIDFQLDFGVPDHLFTKRGQIDIVYFNLGWRAIHHAPSIAA
jgi:hypothetical protein